MRGSCARPGTRRHLADTVVASGREVKIAVTVDGHTERKTPIGDGVALHVSGQAQDACPQQDNPPGGDGAGKEGYTG